MQTNKETKKAIEELREYCRSPECKQWTVVRKLQSPQRLACIFASENVK